MKKVYTAADLPQAYLLSHLLEQAGIGHYIANENLQGGVGELPFTHTYPALWVYDTADYVRARAIIVRFEEAPPQSEGWRCRSCGEGNPPAFELCWKCDRAPD